MKIQWQILVALGLGAKRNWHIFAALILGIIVGVLLARVFPIEPGVEPQNAHVVYQILYVIGQIFIRLIEMIVIPLVLSSLIVGIASLGDGRQLGRLGGKVIFFFILTTAIAAIIGTVLALIAKPGLALQDDIAKFSKTQVEVVQEQAWRIQQEERDIKEMFLNMLPSNPVKSLANAELIPIIIFAIIFGSALTFVGETNRPVIAFFEAVFAATMKIMDWVMVMAVPGIFALTANTVAAVGFDIFKDLLPYIGVILIGLIIQLFVTYPLLLKFLAKVDFRTLYKAVVEAMMVAFGTASSSATLPVTIATAERRAGISNRVSSFVLPLGATMNMDGTALFETVAVIFLAQAYGLDITDPYKLFMLIIMGIVASIAAAGVPSAGLVTMALVLNSIGGFSPQMIVQGIAAIWMIDRFLDMSRTLVNVTSDTVVATIIAASEGELDYDLLSNQEAWKDVV
jgi:Na+/H+-dicarboxylate symporter